MLQDSFNILIKYWPSFAYGIRYTLILSLTGTIIGLVLGLIVGGFRAIPIDRHANKFKKIITKFFQILTTLYIEVFRGTPMMVQAVFIYYAFRPILQWTPISAGIAIISINTGAYMAEIIRSGIQSVDDGQTEASRSLGMTSTQTMRYVIIPQAIKNAFPAIGNEFIVNIKDSCVLNIISCTELFFQSNSIAGSIFKYNETFLITAVIYFILTFTTSRILGFIENRMNNSKSSYPTSQTTTVTMANAKGVY